ncbi:MAG TPA: hypothetical protein VL358_15090 [Caulobacteraceae bacterium]|nr:hypothetical protein [Caulobacteraceae bacterium]
MDYVTAEAKLDLPRRQLASLEQAGRRAARAVRLEREIVLEQPVNRDVAQDVQTTGQRIGGCDMLSREVTEKRVLPPRALLGVEGEVSFLGLNEGAAESDKPRHGAHGGEGERQRKDDGQKFGSQ